jgi:hypothetical protein
MQTAELILLSRSNLVRGKEHDAWIIEDGSRY